MKVRLTTGGDLVLVGCKSVRRELKQQQRRRQRERHKFAYLVDKNNSFARPARAFFTFVHSLPSSAKKQREIAKFEVL